MAIIDDKGLTPKTQQSYLVDLKNRHFAIDPGWDMDPSTPDGMKAQSDSEVLAMLEEAFASIYGSIDPDTAIGEQLDRIGGITNTPRKGATYSTNIVTFKGNAHATVPAGTLVRHKSNGSLWRTNGEIALADNGSGAVAVTCTTPGAVSANIGTLTNIQGGIPDGITSVNNHDAASLGQDVERDDDYRARREKAVSAQASNTIDALEARLSVLPDVKHVRVFENKKPVTDDHGLNRNSIFVCVDGGTDADILRTIAAVKTPGVNDNEGVKTTSPAVVGETRTPRGNPVRLAFFRPNPVSVFMKVTVTSSTFSDSDKKELKAAIMQYAVAGYQLGTGFIKRGFRIGENVTIGRLYTPVNAYVGDTGIVEDLLIGRAANSVSRDPLNVEFNELPVFDADNIAIEVRTP